MSQDEKLLLWATLGLTLLNVVISARIAKGLGEAKASIDKTVSDVKGSPIGHVLDSLGWT